MLVIFVETELFTKRVVRLRLEEPLRALQLELQRNPELGRVDPGTGGLRKVRLPDPNRGEGKRGGARVHYLWLPRLRRIYLLSVYTKNEAESLSIDQKRALADIVRRMRTRDR